MAGTNPVSVGRRKTAVARVTLIAGSGTVTVNKRPLEQYFPIETLRQAVLIPLQITETAGKFDIAIKVEGGGADRSGRRGKPEHCPCPGDDQRRLSPRVADRRTPDPRSPYG